MRNSVLEHRSIPPSEPKSSRPAMRLGTCSAVQTATVPPIEKPASTTRSGGMPHSWPSKLSSARISLRHASHQRSRR